MYVRPGSACGMSPSGNTSGWDAAFPEGLKTAEAKMEFNIGNFLTIFKDYFFFTERTKNFKTKYGQFRKKTNLRLDGKECWNLLPKKNSPLETVGSYCLWNNLTQIPFNPQLDNRILSFGTVEFDSYCNNLATFEYCQRVYRCKYPMDYLSIHQTYNYLQQQETIQK